MDPEQWMAKLKPFWPVFLAFFVVFGGTLYGVAPAILILAGGLLVLALVLVWMSLGELTSEEPLTLEEALELGAPDHREQEKASVLRALKDLEQERRFGKITEDEFATESARLRQHAKRLLASLDESAKARRNRVESRLRRAIQNRAKTHGAAVSDSNQG